MFQYDAPRGSPCLLPEQARSAALEALWSIQTSKWPGGDTATDAFGHDVEVLEYDLVGAQFTVDAVLARLESEGVQIVRSSPFYLNVQAGGIARLGEHKIVFKTDDKDAVGQALRDAGML